MSGMRSTPNGRRDPRGRVAGHVRAQRASRHASDGAGRHPPHHGRGFRQRLGQGHPLSSLPASEMTELDGRWQSGQLPSSVRRILLATDLSPTSVPATIEAFAIAGRLQAELLIVSVIDAAALRLPGGRFLARVDQVRERRQAAAQELVQRGRREGVPVTFLVWEGEPGESILEAAKAEQVDMIVLGSHGRGPIGRLLLGSVSQHVVRQAPVPVVVVRQDADKDPTKSSGPDRWRQP